MPLEDIDPIYFERTYHLAPAGDAAANAYALLAAVMDERQRVGIGKVVMREKQYLAAIRPYGKGLALSTMLFADEVVAQSDVDGIPSAAPRSTAARRSSRRRSSTRSSARGTRSATTTTTRSSCGGSSRRSRRASSSRSRRRRSRQGARPHGGAAGEPRAQLTLHSRPEGGEQEGRRIACVVSQQVDQQEGGQQEGELTQSG